jgi:hypothetical protein
MLDMSVARERMVERQVARRGMRDTHVTEAMRQVPREAFVPAGLEEFAYEDSPLPIEAGQTISQPYIVAVMIEAADIRPGDRGAGDRGRVRLCGRRDEPHREPRLRDRAA